MSINNCQAIQKRCIDRRANAWLALGSESETGSLFYIGQVLFFCVFMDFYFVSVHKHAKKITRPISSLYIWDKIPKNDKFSLRYKARIPSGKKAPSCPGSGSQSKRKIRVQLVRSCHNLGQNKWNIWTTPSPSISMMPEWRVFAPSRLHHYFFEGEGEVVVK